MAHEHWTVLGMGALVALPPQAGTRPWLDAGLSVLAALTAPSRAEGKAAATALAAALSKPCHGASGWTDP